MTVELVEHVARITVVQAGRTCERLAVVEEIVTVALIANIEVGHRMPFQRQVIGQNATRRRKATCDDRTNVHLRYVDIGDAKGCIWIVVRSKDQCISRLLRYQITEAGEKVRVRSTRELVARDHVPGAYGIVRLPEHAWTVVLVAEQGHVRYAERVVREPIDHRRGELQQKNEIDENVVVGFEDEFRRATEAKRPFEQRENAMGDQGVLLWKFDLDDVVKEFVLQSDVVAELLVEVDEEEKFDAHARVRPEILARAPRASDGIACSVVLGFRDDGDEQIDGLVRARLGIVQHERVEASPARSTHAVHVRTDRRRAAVGRRTEKEARQIRANDGLDEIGLLSMHGENVLFVIRRAQLCVSQQ